MFKFFKGVVGGSGAAIRDLPYNIVEPYPSAWGSWVHHRGTSKEDGSPVSIFSLSGSNVNDGHLVAGRNGVKRLRTERERDHFSQFITEGFVSYCKRKRRDNVHDNKSSLEQFNSRSRK